MNKPKTSEQVGQMISTGKTIDAAVARAVRKALGNPKSAKKNSVRSPRARRAA